MPPYPLGLYTAVTEMILEKSSSNAKNYLFFLAAKHILLLKMYREMKNWWRNKGQSSKNRHLKLVCYTRKKQPDFSQELGLCQLPVCSGEKQGAVKTWGTHAPWAAAFPCSCCCCCSGQKWEIQVKASTWKIFVPAFPVVHPASYHEPIPARWDRDQPRETAVCCLECPWGNRDTLPRNVLMVWYPQVFP